MKKASPYDDDDILAMAVMAKNCMITVGQYSPQTAVFGTQPGILPDQDREQSHLEDAEDGILSRNTHRLREIALQEIITITARQRVKAAQNSRTRQAIQVNQYKFGDNVEFWRNPWQKDCQAGVVLQKECKLIPLMR